MDSRHLMLWLLVCMNSLYNLHVSQGWCLNMRHLCCAYGSQYSTRFFCFRIRSLYLDLVTVYRDVLTQGDVLWEMGSSRILLHACPCRFLRYSDQVLGGFSGPK